MTARVTALALPPARHLTEVSVSCWIQGYGFTSVAPR
jgi:hypothetical protein